MTLLLNCSLPRDAMSQLTPSALSNSSGAIHVTPSDLPQRPTTGTRAIASFQTRLSLRLGFLSTRQLSTAAESTSTTKTSVQYYPHGPSIPLNSIQISGKVN